MTKKDYIPVAGVLKRHMTDEIAVQQTLLLVARDLADIFQLDNPRFDRHKFYVACGVAE